MSSDLLRRKHHLACLFWVFLTYCHPLFHRTFQSKRVSFAQIDCSPRMFVPGRRTRGSFSLPVREGIASSMRLDESLSVK